MSLKFFISINLLSEARSLVNSETGNALKCLISPLSEYLFIIIALTVMSEVFFLSILGIWPINNPRDWEFQQCFIKNWGKKIMSAILQLIK